MLILKVYVFSKQKSQTSRESIPGNAASQNAFVEVSWKWYIQNNFRAASVDGPTSKTPQKTSDKLYTLLPHRGLIRNNKATFPSNWLNPISQEPLRMLLLPESKK